MASTKGVICGACVALSVVALLTYSYLTNAGNRLTLWNIRWDQILHEAVHPIVGSPQELEQNYSILASNHSSITVVCMIITTPGKWSSRARAVLNTWAKRCHIPLFFYSRAAAPPGHAIIGAAHTVPLDVPEGRGHLTGKTMAALRYSLQTYGHVADWFLKCDDDTYVVWENLLYLLGQHRGLSRVYLGRLIQNYIPHGYTSGGAGYVISKPAVRKILDEGRKYPADCPKDGGIEDYDLGRCLAKFGIYPSGSYGADGRLRFHSDNPVTLTDGHQQHAKYYFFSTGNVTIGNAQKKKTDHVMSKDTATFHYVTPGQMYMFDFLLYGLARHWPPSSTTSGTSTVTTATPTRSTSTNSTANHTRRP